jgi:hypothetical protein
MATPTASFSPRLGVGGLARSSRILLDLIDATINVRVSSQLATVVAEEAPRSRLAALARMCVELGSAAPDVIAVVLHASIADPELARCSVRWPKDGGVQQPSEPGR